MSTPAPALGDIQKQIQDKVAEIRARIKDLKSQLPFKPPGFLDQPILQRGTAQGQGILRRNILRRPQATSPGVRRTGTPLCPPCSPAIVDIGPTRTSRSGAAISEEIDPTRRFGISIAT